MKKFFGNEKSITKMVLLFTMVGLIIFLGALKVESSKNPGYGYGYYMPWGYYGWGYQYWNPNPVGGTHSNGTLIKGTTATVYLLEIGEKRSISSWTTFLCRGFTPGAIITVSNAERDGYANGSDLLCPSGTLLKGTTAAVYVINEDVNGAYTKRLITTPAVFEAAGFSWSNIYTVSDTELGWYAAGSNFDETATVRPNGSLVKVSYLASVYVLDSGQRRLILSPTAFVSNGYSWSKILTISMMELNGYTVGNPIQAAKGTLLKTSSSSGIYVVDLVGGTYYKRWISSWSVFVSKGYDPAKINTVSQEEIDTFSVALQIT